MEDASLSQPGPQLGPQPDFRRMAQGLQQVCTELAKFANLSPIAQSAAILEQMQQNQQQMEQQFQQMRQQMEQQFQQMQQNHQQTQQQFQRVHQQIGQVRQDVMQVQQRVLQVDQRVLQVDQRVLQVDQQVQQLRTDFTMGHQAIEYNSIARFQNSGVARSDHSPTTLREFTTNADIQGFPATPAQLSNELIALSLE
ncbi:hypothetical protein K505DRAFT_412507 [Melanomma pulvis-pyrius CBS 109.77]|uniref:Uncharacterized protein n=1 Tax=Melanomma pulvis-pyrius CBS 109.77 TaxID=1314802 RepID=A0A6A6XYC0_9PLEO|nr:hypothetical protein K505DRAFT_412507 [Melanomma pulvis-pyrius CBS 109.77]